MARIPKPLEEARSNLEAAIPAIPARYQAAIQRATWAQFAASDAAESNFAQRMQAAIAAKARQAGIRRVGDQAWKSGALEKGVARIGPGLQAALDKWQSNFGRVYQAIVSAQRSLPPRTTDPMQNIDRRLKPIVQAAVQYRIRGRS